MFTIKCIKVLTLYVHNKHNKSLTLSVHNKSLTLALTHWNHPTNPMPSRLNELLQNTKKSFSISVCPLKWATYLHMVWTQLEETKKITLSLYEENVFAYTYHLPLQFTEPSMWKYMCTIVTISTIMFQTSQSSIKASHLSSSRKL